MRLGVKGRKAPLSGASRPEIALEGLTCDRLIKPN